MLPTIKLFGFALQSFALAQGVAVLLSFWLLRELSRTYKISDTLAFWSWFGLLSLAVISSYVAGAVLYQWGVASTSSSEASIVGPLITLPLFLSWMDRRQKQPLLLILLPAFIVVQFVGKIGCYMAGCCFGRPTAAWFGIRPARYFESAWHGWFLTPIQLFEAGAIAVACLIAYLIAKRGKSIASQGRMFLAYFILYDIARFITEFYRGDVIYTSVGLTRAQLAMPICIVATIYAIILHKRSHALQLAAI